ncbi:MAG: hypothetical protein ACRD5R_16760 [Candidatus Acidiferrales bacterium]
MPEFLAGWSKHRIHPPAGYPMAGYLARERPSSGSLDPLYVRALCLKEGSTTAVILLADVLLISTRRSAVLRRRIGKALKIPAAWVTIAATHTHSGPLIDTEPFNFSGMPGDSRMKIFQRRLEHLFSQAALSASRRVRRVRVSCSTPAIRNVASDRNRPRLAKTQRFLLFRFQSSRGAALLAIYGCHPTVLGPANCLFSGDLHGGIASQFERVVDVALVANGAAGNVSTRFTRREQSRAELIRLAGTVIRQAKGARSAPLPNCGLASQHTILRLPLRSTRPSGLHPFPSRRKGRLQTVALEAALVRAHLRQSAVFAGKSITVSISALRIGPVTLVFLPFEIFSSTGRFLWRTRKIFPLCYANGYWGYLPGPAAKPGDYEVISSSFPVTADAELRRTILALTKPSVR